MHGQHLHYIASGSIKTPDDELPERLKAILNSLAEVIAQHQPQQVAVEKVFVKLVPLLNPGNEAIYWSPLTRLMGMESTLAELKSV